jgi:hypothetical protein
MPLILDRRSVKTCHILLPDEPKAIGGIIHEQKLFGFVRAYADWESAKRGIDRLEKLGNTVVLTRTPRGLVLWVLEPDARLA